MSRKSLLPGPSRFALRASNHVIAGFAGGALMLVLINVYYAIRIQVLDIDGNMFSYVDFGKRFFMVSFTIVLISTPVSIVLLAFSSWREKMPSPTWFASVYTAAAVLCFLGLLNNPNTELFGSLSMGSLFPIFIATGMMIGTLYGYLSRAEVLTYRAWCSDT